MKHVNTNNSSSGYCGKTLFWSTLSQTVGQLMIAATAWGTTVWLPAWAVGALAVIGLVAGHFGAQATFANMFAKFDKDPEIGLAVIRATMHLSSESVTGSWIAAGLGAIPLMLVCPEALIAYALFNLGAWWSFFVGRLELDYQESRLEDFARIAENRRKCGVA